MKRLTYFLLCAIATMFVACNSSNSKTEMAAENSALSDSLMIVNAEKDSLFALLNDINSDLMQIKDLEKLLSTTDFSKETPNKREQIKNDIELLKKTLEERRNKLAQLESKLKKANNKNAELEKTIASLKQQIDSQEETILEMTKALQDAQFLIEWQNEHIDSLTVQNQVVTEEKQAIQEKNKQLTEKLNTCYYVIGSKSELSDNKIIETGFLRKTKVMEGNFDKSYFTKADKRTLMNINLHSGKANVLSKHPAESYIIVDVDGSKVLQITDPIAFWDTSNYLVVQID